MTKLKRFIPCVMSSTQAQQARTWWCVKLVAAVMPFRKFFCLSAPLRSPACNRTCVQVTQESLSCRVNSPTLQVRQGHTLDKEHLRDLPTDTLVPSK